MKERSKALLKQWNATNRLNNRPNKIAKGMSFTNERKARTKKYKGLTCDIPLSMTALTLSVKGTTDKLCKPLTGQICKLVKVPHPTDKGYFKEAFVLTDRGRAILKSKRYELKHKS